MQNDALIHSSSIRECIFHLKGRNVERAAFILIRNSATFTCTDSEPFTKTPCMTRERFEHIAQEAFDSLPNDFTDRVENVRIVVEDYPDDDALQSVKARRYSLLGLYQGIPLPKRGTWYGMTATLPDKITLYQKNIEAVCRSDEEIEHRIVEVLFHELGHYFGMDEAQVRAAMKRFM